MGREGGGPAKILVNLCKSWLSLLSIADWWEEVWERVAERSKGSWQGKGAGEKGKKK